MTTTSTPIPAVPWAGSHVTSKDGIVEGTTPSHPGGCTVAIQLAPGRETVRILLEAAIAADDGKSVLLTAQTRGRNRFKIHAATTTERDAS
jgi:hypothetical protein